VDPLSRALVAVILHDIANTTQYLKVLNAMLSESGAPARVLDGLPETTNEVEDLGFVLGMVAFGAGADILHDRARRDGLDVLLAFVKRALRHEQRDLAANATPLPRVRIDAPDRGRLATWASARFVFAAARGRSLSAQEAAELTFVFDVHSNHVRLACRVPPCAEIERCAQELQALSADIAFESDATTSTLVMPARFFETDS